MREGAHLLHLGQRTLRSQAGEPPGLHRRGSRRQTGPRRPPRGSRFQTPPSRKGSRKFGRGRGAVGGWLESEMGWRGEEEKGGERKGKEGHTSRTFSCRTAPRRVTRSRRRLWYLSRIWSSSTILGPSPPEGKRGERKKFAERGGGANAPIRMWTSGWSAQTFGRAAIRRSMPFR